MFDFPNFPIEGQIVTASNGANYRWDGAKWVVVGPPPSTVQSFNGRTGNVLMTQGDIAYGLGYTAYDAANPAKFVADAPSDAVGYVRLSAGWANGDTRYMQQAAGDARYLKLDGSAPMVGPLTLAGPPSSPLHAVPKSYADALPYVAFGSGSVTGVTTETNLAALRIPANTLGANGAAELKTLWTHTGNANNKSLIIRISPVAGSTAGGVTGGTTVVASSFQSTHMIWHMKNINDPKVQNYPNTTGIGPYGSSLNLPVGSTVDTTADCFVNINGMLAVGTDTLTLLHAYLVVFPHA